MKLLKELLVEFNRGEISREVERVRRYLEASDKDKFTPEEIHQAVRRVISGKAMSTQLPSQVRSELMALYRRQNKLMESKLLNVPTMSVKQLANKHRVSIEHIEKQLKQGMKVELEHTTKKNVAREIALDHIAEDPNYYTKLKKVEESYEDEIDMTDKVCKKCKKGKYGETSIHDDWDGVLHCRRCGHEVKRWEKSKNETPRSRLRSN